MSLLPKTKQEHQRIYRLWNSIRPILFAELLVATKIGLITTRCYSRTDFQTAIQFVAGDQVNVSLLISHELPLERISEGFALMEKPEEVLKIIIRP
ncbi:threonine dehydrogenase-like Zn-dependent dehydrogenase [Paenibacillus sp. PvR052]